LILVLVADEETGGSLGAEFLVNHHWDKIKATYLLNEGAIGVIKEGMHLYPIQVAEKGVAWMQLTAQGSSGHGSMPLKDNAVIKLSQAVQLLGQYKFPIVPTQTVQRLFKVMAPHLSFPKSLAMRFFFTPVVGPILQKFFREEISQDPKIAAILANTIAPTNLKAGYKTNVIPAEAIAEIDARIVPGETPEGFRDTVQKIVGKDIQAELIMTSMPNESRMDTPFYEAIERAIADSDPEAVIAPMMSSGATDSRFFRDKGVISYGLIPALIPVEDVGGMHGKNERIPVHTLEKGTQTLYAIIQRILAKNK
jgi:acetylornithine deacetylase/succinyl-diaminopimelate desuccinylase-like protein